MLFDKLVKSENEALRIVADALSDNKKLILSYFNQHCFNIYKSHSDYKNLLDNNCTVFLDGLGVYAALKFLGYKNVQKFNATDLYYKILQRFSVNQTKLFLIGSSFTGEFISLKVKENKLNICGYQDGYFKDGRFNLIIEKISNSSPEVIIIGMGVPKQEILAAKISGSIQNKVILCVGGFFEFYFGTKKRAPDVIRYFGFEWLHRLIKEPRRLWKRYFKGIPVFLFKIIELKFSSRKD